ncbi:MAG: NDP-sugar synthase, partial [Clostridia bacterium]|nr:NDP-sugar synthase [Clostridia bacterium]
MKGIIMAGGEGTRLRPLTCDQPKPMIELMGRPLMGYAIGLLKRHGITDIGVTLGYMPDAVTERFADGGDMGVSLRYFVERAPMGTAGGVKLAGAFLDETFVVLSGDGLTDLDIGRAAAFHRARGALATLVLKRADDPVDYGVVDVDAEGRVRSFHEKPDWSEVLSDTINTGIYILEPEVLKHIPVGRPYDFGHELFPKLVKDGLPVYGYVTDGYWCDVGDARAYLSAHADAMEGRVDLDGLTGLGGRAVLRPGAVVDRAAVLEGPCLIE